MPKTRVPFGIAGLISAAVLLILSPAYADLGKVEIGAKMPEFKLTDLNGDTHELSDYKGKIVVINFLSKDCPWSRGAEPAVSGLAGQYVEKSNVVFIGIDSNAGTTRDAMAKYASSVPIPYPIALDEGNAYADSLGATRTPEIYIVAPDGTLAYHGAYDDRTSPDETGGVNYTKNAIDALLANKTIEKPEVSAWGCMIKRAPKKLS